MDTTTTVYYGVMDPEMKAIVQIATKMGIDIVAATAKGMPVDPSNAYDADPVPELRPGDRLVLVECEPLVIPKDVTVVRIDHHRKGDRGWNMPPAQYWEGSSLGQFADMFKVPATRYLRALAAMDHCFQAALAGECPHVQPKVVLGLKIAAIAEAANCRQLTVRKLVGKHQRKLRAMPNAVRINGQGVIDYRQHDLGVGWSVDLLSAQVAVALERRVALFRHRDRQGGPHKVTLSGYATPEMVVAFQKVWAPANGLEKAYGHELRGYAGAYERSR